MSTRNRMHVKQLVRRSRKLARQASQQQQSLVQALQGQPQTSFSFA